MKKYILGLAIIAIAFAFTPGETCESFFPQKVGTKWELTHYDKSDKAMSKSKYELISVNEIPGGLEAKIGIETTDDKNKSLSKGEMGMKCEGDKFFMDMSGMFNNSQMQQIEGMDIKVEISNQYLEFPSNPTAGTVLPDAETTMTVKGNGITFMSSTIKLTNRKIEGYEDVVTPAGTYRCMKYSADEEYNSKMYKNKSHGIMYMAKNVGMVKTENYNDKNELESKTILTSFTN